ncbi:MAG TPA: hypothetical protein VM802_06905 [Chitinophaga sp.]|uniref:plasmid mobilization protein n=1 Tax=Chitinophaga sp. TaxID=1869181 RepID=UPI002C8ED179|nr:hypothetical protein [Chitinophaga sp.]HVI44579.1 hypothetical protein [Chitinophaga sp.]
MDRVVQQKGMGNRDRWLHVRLTATEYELVENRYRRSDNKYMSAYLRDLLLRGSYRVVHRDGTLEAVVPELSALHKDLEKMAANFNQVVKKVNAASTGLQLKVWVMEVGKQQREFLAQMEKIEVQIGKVTERWLQK